MSRRRLIVVALAGIAFAALGCSRAEPGASEHRLTVSEHGFNPLRLDARRGEPLTLLVTRTSDASCAKEILVPEMGIRESLPIRREVRITFTPARSGDLRYTCCDDMKGGVIAVR